MSVFSPDVNIDSPVPLPIDGGNPNPVLITGSVSLTGSTDGLALDASIQTLITDVINGSLHAHIDNFPAVQPVSGTFWQAIQPVSGTFWQAIQPVSGTVSVSNFPATVAVTQSTSPWVVSGTVTANLGTIDGAATAANQATELTDLTSIIANQTNGTQTVSVLNFPADADALAQGSTTAGQLGALEMGAVTTAAPVYVTGTTRPLSLDTAGNLRVATVPISPSTATITSVAVSTTAVQLLAARVGRVKVILVCPLSTVYIAADTTASAAHYTWVAASNNTEIEITNYSGPIWAVKAGLPVENVAVTDF